jgi:hypothetical protein
MQKTRVDELAVILKMLRKIEKIIKSNELCNRWYESGHIKIFGLSTGLALLPIVEVWRLRPDEEGEQLNMDKQTKDKITSLLKKNDCIYFEMYDCYIYGGDILKKIKK